MKRLLVLSDNHGLREPLEKAEKHFEGKVDYMIHCGDACLPLSRLQGYTAVPGNMDYPPLYPSMTQILEIEGHHILAEHGHKTIPSGTKSPDYNAIAADGKRNGCDIVLFGHTHRYLDTTVDGIRLLNPGSCNRARAKDPQYATMMLVTIDGGNVDAEMIKCADL